jgi:hypothetical protein
LQWWTPVPLNSGGTSDPFSGYNLNSVGTNGLSMRGNWTEFVGTFKLTGVNQIQPRIRNVLTGGYIEVHMELSRVMSFDNPSEIVGQIRASNATVWIENGAIGTAQVGQLFAENITVAQLSRSVQGLVASNGRIELDANRVRVFDSNNNVRVKMGYLL